MTSVTPAATIEFIRNHQQSQKHASCRHAGLRYYPILYDNIRVPFVTRAMPVVQNGMNAEKSPEPVPCRQPVPLVDLHPSSRRYFQTSSLVSRCSAQIRRNEAVCGCVCNPVPRCKEEHSGSQSQRIPGEQFFFWVVVGNDVTRLCQSHTAQRSANPKSVLLNHLLQGYQCTAGKKKCSVGSHAVFLVLHLPGPCDPPVVTLLKTLGCACLVE